MRSASTYQAAGIVAESIEQYFLKHHEAASGRGQKDMAPLPEAGMVEAIIDTSFWASLRREEGHDPRISLAYLPPEFAGQPMLFEKKLPLTPANLTKLSPGVERPGVHLGVWVENNNLYIWGTTLRIPDLCFVLDVSEPGLLVIKHRRLQGFGKFANIAVLVGDQVKIVSEESTLASDCPPMLKSLLSFTSPASWNDMENVLVQLAVSMRAHKHGGTLLVVPANQNQWEKSIIQPLKYRVTPPYGGLKDLINRDKSERGRNQWQNKLKAEIDSMAGLTAIDGATIITDSFEVLAFGTKISRQKGHARVEKIYLNEPIVGADSEVVNPAQTGGTRHLSAAQFVYDQHDSIAMVASQDGHFTVFSWSDEQEMVQAHKIDTLLL